MKRHLKLKKPSQKALSRNASTILLIVIFLVGLSLLLYPSISNYVNERHQSRAIATYDAAVSKLNEEDYDAYFKAARKYNKKLAENPSAFYEPDAIEGYDKILDVTGTGIMGYVAIEKIGVELPIYHGTSEGVLAAGAGHLEGTSFPIGGKSTHSVISAHRGLPSAKLFTNLDKLEEGDIFTITILNRVITYEVDKISIVLPSQTQDLKIEDGKDYCTLMTCTPYGINTHRLLVRGRCIDNSELQKIHITAEAFQIRPTIIASIIGIFILLLLLLRVLIHSRRKRRHVDAEDYLEK